ncbi:recombination regulator RecX [Actinoallomurus rhizosphaericola]|uniref:recombination regulator RecX n=1 Tax=Actinoallomurus rhizosphaericola TaxID=2952536 RepID=UPI002091D7CD|nr:recombination regulator RecX [Actinoallomurus rhizosphaericola]MCO5992383.1 recombination regulator RecX [Actinoallomurus rhizosphaericola]
MNAPEGWRRPAPRRADPGTEIFPGDAAPAQRFDPTDPTSPAASTAAQSGEGAAETPVDGAEASAAGRSGRRGRRRGRDRSPEGPTPGSPAAQGPPVDPEAVAREICLRQLSFSPKTRAQLADALRRKGVPDDVAERVLSRYSEVGLIDDAAFARAWVESRHAGRGLARRALAAELRRRGVADETVSEAVEELGPEQEEAAARELVARRLPGTRGLDPVKRTRRLMGMLARKGYSGGLAYRVVREALEAEGAEELPDLSFDD